MEYMHNIALVYLWVARKYVDKVFFIMMYHCESGSLDTSTVRVALSGITTVKVA